MQCRVLPAAIGRGWAPRGNLFRCYQLPLDCDDDATITAALDGVRRFVSRNAIGSIFSGSGPTLEPSDGRYNFLMMGGDAGADRTGRRPDSLSVISVDAKRIFKPSSDAYTLIESTLKIPPGEVLFISSNPWDVCGAKSFGLNVAWIERVTPEAMALACLESDTLPPLTMFKAIRTQMDELGFEPDYRIRALSELPALISGR